MNPIEAYEYMKKTGKTVKANRQPPWIDNPDWIKFRYQLYQHDMIATLFDNASCAALVVSVSPAEKWMNWWMNFCYNNPINKTELIPSEHS